MWRSPREVGYVVGVQPAADGEGQALRVGTFQRQLKRGCVGAHQRDAHPA
jgi:hypothetical protein